jgi:hypothetical protein
LPSIHSGQSRSERRRLSKVQPCCSSHDLTLSDGFKPCALAVDDLLHAFQHANTGLLTKDANNCEKQLSSLVSQATKKSQSVEPPKGLSGPFNFTRSHLHVLASYGLRFSKALGAPSDSEMQVLSRGVSVKGDVVVLVPDAAKTPALMDSLRAQLDKYDVCHQLCARVFDGVNLDLCRQADPVAAGSRGTSRRHPD